MVSTRSIRQAVAVVVTVPGLRSPGLGIGAASHEVVAGTSTVQVEVQNTGNVRLKPTVGFTLFDPSGAAISHATVPMDTFYANTDTTMEFPLAALLSPGRYTVTLTLHDGAQGADADRSGIPLIVEAAVDPPAEVGTVPGLIGVNQAAGEGPSHFLESCYLRARSSRSALPPSPSGGTEGSRDEDSVI